MGENSATTATLDEREVYRGYDRQRRLDLTRGIAPAFSAILFAFVAVVDVAVPRLAQTGVYADHSQRIVLALLLSNPILLGCVASGIFATVASRRGQVGAATFFTVITTDVSVITIEFLWAFGIGGFDYISIGTFAALCMAIFLAGMIGERWMLLSTTVLMNVIVLLVCLFVPAPQVAAGEHGISDVANSQRFILLSGAILVQWAVTTIALAASVTYQRIMRELGDVRVAFQRSQQLDDLKDQFISNVNHELRGPVMAMQGYLELLEVANENADAQKRQSLLQRAQASGDNLVALLNSILGTRQMDREAADFVPESVNVLAAVQIAAGLLDPREVSERGRALKVTIPPTLTIWGEQVRLQQIMVNLLSNALKYSPSGFPVEVTATTITETEKKSAPFGRTLTVTRQMAEISVRDYGLGIPPDQAPLLFGRFVRLPRDLASTVVGNGLGLYLCRTLTEAMGGRIWVESSGIDGEGSTFHVVLPTRSDA